MSPNIIEALAQLTEEWSLATTPIPYAAREKQLRELSNQFPDSALARSFSQEATEYPISKFKFDSWWKVLPQENEDQERALLGLKLFGFEVLSYIDKFRTEGQNEDPSKEIFAVVRLVLEEEEYSDSEPIDRLARALMPHLFQFGKQATLELEELSNLDQLTEDGMVWLDSLAAQYIDRELKDRDFSKKYRERSRARLSKFKDEKETTFESLRVLFRPWLPKFYLKGEELQEEPSKDHSWINFFTPEYVLVFARTLWTNTVEPRLNRERAKPRALVFPVLKEAIDAHTPGGQLQHHQGSNILVNHRGELVAPLKRIEPLKVPTLELSVLPQILRKGSKLLGTLNAYRLLHLEVSLGHQRALDDIKDFRALRFEGGWGAVAEAAGIEGNSRAISEVHAIIAAQAHLCWVSPDGTYGNLLSYEVRPARRNQRGRVSLILGDSLLPDFIFSEGFFGNGRKARESRRLVPMLPLPPLVGRDKDKGAQVNLQLRILAEMRQRAGELYQEGGILLSPHQLEEFAKDAALPLATLNKVIERWTKDGDDGPALLELIEDHRYTLGKTHQTAKDFITQAGEEEIKGREAGLKSRELDRKHSKKRTPHE